MRPTSSHASYSCGRTRIPHYTQLLEHCRSHNEFSDYEPFVYRWTDEEFCNTAVTLPHITDRMMSRYLEFL